MISSTSSEAFTSSAAKVTELFVTITGKIFAYALVSAFQAPDSPSQRTDLTLRDRRKQEDCRRKGTEEHLCCSQKVIPYAEVQVSTESKCIDHIYIPPIDE
jgi:hypothetical protein